MTGIWLGASILHRVSWILYDVLCAVIDFHGVSSDFPGFTQMSMDLILIFTDFIDCHKFYMIAFPFHGFSWIFL